MERIGPTMERALALLRDGERADRVYGSALALARDVAGACGITRQAARHSVGRLLRDGLVERRGGALRLAREGERALARRGAPAVGSSSPPRPASSRAPARPVRAAPGAPGGTGARLRGPDQDRDRDRSSEGGRDREDLGALFLTASRLASRRSRPVEGRALPADGTAPEAGVRGAPAARARCPSCGGTALAREPHPDPAVHLHRCRRCRAVVMT